VWRTPVFYRLFFPAVGLLLLGLSVVDFDGGSDLPSTTLDLTLGLVLILGPFRPCVRLYSDAVFARGVVLSRSIPLRDLEDIVPGYHGLNLVTTAGKSFQATGVGEKWNITDWLGKRSRADDLADVLLAARDAARRLDE
jgi:hypothetical protein